MYFPESEKLLAKAPSKEEHIRDFDKFLYAQNGKVIIVKNTAFYLDLRTTELLDFFPPFIESGTLTKEDRAECPKCPDELIEPDYSPDNRQWQCCHCGGTYSEREVKIVDCYRIKKIKIASEPNSVLRPIDPESKKGINVLDKEALAHGRIKPWKVLQESEYLVRTNQLNNAAEQNILENLEKLGFCLVRIEGQTPQAEILTAVEGMLGHAVESQNGVAGKIKEISPSEAIAATTGDSAKELAFHTDGTQEQDLPPAILAFQYLTTPKFGGRSTFIDLASVIHNFNDEELLQILKDLACPDAGTSEKKGLSYTGPLVKPVRNNQSLSFRLRFDEVLSINPNSQVSFRKLRDSILREKEYLTYSPQEGDIAIFDNWRVMHGRAAVGGTHMRFHNRMWIQDLKQSLATKYLLGVRGLSSEVLVELRKINQAER